MKKIYSTVVMLFMAITLFGQNQPADYMYLQEKEGNVFFEEVKQIPGATDEELYSRAREWFVVTYKSADNVLQMDDKTSGKLIGKAWQQITVGSGLMTGTPKFWYQVSIYVKEGRYKFNISQMSYDYSGAISPAENYLAEENFYNANGKPKKINKSYDDQTHIAINALGDDLEKFMNGKGVVTTSTGEEW